MKLSIRIVGVLAALLVLLAGALAIYVYATAVTPSRAVGFQQLTASDPGHRPIPVAVWYPTTDKPGFVLLDARGMRVARDGPVDGERLPLVIMSHGTGGWGLGHADTAIALAEQGFVVAAPTHPGDNVRDSSEVGRPDWLVDRVRHLTRTADALLGAWKDRGHIDARRIGLFGFSAGATTALVSLGGIPNLDLIASQCDAHPEFVCTITKPEAYRNLAPVNWVSDPRFKAAVIAAPGLGFTFEPNGLSKVRAPLQLWAGKADDIVPFDSNAGVVERLLPAKAELHVVPGAVHYSFLMPCGLFGPPQLCGDPKGFDRRQFHKQFNQEVARFLRQQLISSARR